MVICKITMFVKIYLIQPMTNPSKDTEKPIKWKRLKQANSFLYDENVPFL